MSGIFCFIFPHFTVHGNSTPNMCAYDLNVRKKHNSCVLCISYAHLSAFWLLSSFFWRFSMECKKCIVCFHHSMCTLPKLFILPVRLLGDKRIKKELNCVLFTLSLHTYVARAIHMASMSVGGQRGKKK